MVTFGQMATTFGRKPTLILSMVILSVALLIGAFSTSYVMYSVCMCFVAFGQSGIFEVAFILVRATWSTTCIASPYSLSTQCVEIVSKKHRVYSGIIIEYFYVVGEVLLTVFAFWLRDWKWIMLAIAIPSILCLLFVFWLPESPRWLLRTQR